MNTRPNWLRTGNGGARIDTSRPWLPRRAIPDNQSTELDNVVPLRPTHDLSRHDPVHQAPTVRERVHAAVVSVIGACALLAAMALTLWLGWPQ